MANAFSFLSDQKVKIKHIYNYKNLQVNSPKVKKKRNGKEKVNRNSNFYNINLKTKYKKVRERINEQTHSKKMIKKNKWIIVYNHLCEFSRT